MIALLRLLPLSMAVLSLSVVSKSAFTFFLLKSNHQELTKELKKEKN
jgi:hypothetical protein